MISPASRWNLSISFFPDQGEDMQEFMMGLLFWLAMPMALIVLVALWILFFWVIWDEMLGIAQKKIENEEGDRDWR